MARQLSLRLLGLLAAAVVLAAAAQLLVLGVSGDALLGPRDADTTMRWMGRSHGEGAEVLVGVGIVALGCWFVWAFVSTSRTPRSVITTRRESGWTRVDRRYLAKSIERALGAQFPDATISTRIRRTRRVDTTVTTAEPFPGPLLDEVSVALQQLINDHALPCTAGPVTAREPRHVPPSRVR